MSGVSLCYSPLCSKKKHDVFVPYPKDLMSDQYIPTFLCTELVLNIGKLQNYFPNCFKVVALICVVTPLLKANFGVFIVAAQNGWKKWNLIWKAKRLELGIKKKKKRKRKDHGCLIL